MGLDNQNILAPGHHSWMTCFLWSSSGPKPAEMKLKSQEQEMERALGLATVLEPLSLLIPWVFELLRVRAKTCHVSFGFFLSQLELGFTYSWKGTDEASQIGLTWLGDDTGSKHWRTRCGPHLQSLTLPALLSLSQSSPDACSLGSVF